MSQLSNMPVDNGQRLRVTSEFFNGTAGVTGDEGGGEFACPGAMPLRMPGLTGTVGGRMVRITALRKSAVVPGMLVVRFDYLGDDE